MWKKYIHSETFFCFFDLQHGAIVSIATDFGLSHVSYRARICLQRWTVHLLECLASLGNVWLSLHHVLKRQISCFWLRWIIFQRLSVTLSSVFRSAVWRYGIFFLCFTELARLKAAAYIGAAMTQGGVSHFRWLNSHSDRAGPRTETMTWG